MKPKQIFQSKNTVCLFERFRAVVETSSSVLLEGPSNPWTGNLMVIKSFHHRPTKIVLGWGSLWYGYCLPFLKCRILTRPDYPGPVFLVWKLSPLCPQWSWHKNNDPFGCIWLQKLPRVCPVFVLVVVVRIWSPESSHLALLPLLSNNQNRTSHCEGGKICFIVFLAIMHHKSATCIRLSLAVSIAFKVSRLMGILEPKMGVSKTQGISMRS